MSEEQLSWHRKWIALDDHRLRLLDIWSDLNSRLEGQVGWFDLSNAAQAKIEQTSGLSDLDTTLRLIDRRLRHWLRALPKEPTDDVVVVVASLQVAERLLPPEENRIVNGLIARAVRDLSQMQVTVTRRRRGTDRHLAATFCENARSFHAMARYRQDQHGAEPAYCWAIAIELSLKAYLLHRGLTDQWSRVRIRHDLTKALRCARRAGLKVVPEGLPNLVQALSPDYASGALSRGLRNPSIPMLTEAIDQVIGDLLLLVETIIGTGRGTE